MDTEDYGISFDRDYEKRLTLFGLPVRLSMVLSLMLVLFIGSLFIFISTLNFVWLVIEVFSIIMMVYIRALSRKKILYIGKYSLEIGPDRVIYLTKLVGQCSECKGALKIRKRQAFTKKFETYIECSKYKHHVWRINSDYY